MKREILLVTCIAFLLTIILTWPFATNIGQFSTDSGDYALNSSVLKYNYESILSGKILRQGEYFSGYQFYPHPFSLAFSDHLFVPSLLFFPIYLISKNLIFSVNFLSFLSFVFSFLSCYLFLRFFLRSFDHSLSKLASIIGAFVFTFNPVTFSHFPDHFQLLGKYFLPLLFIFAYRLLKKPNFKDSFLFFLFFTLNALSSIYYLIFSLITLSLVILLFVISNLLSRNWVYPIKLLRAGLIGLVFLPVLLYFNLPYVKFSENEIVQRSIDESYTYSGYPSDWFFSMPQNLASGGITRFFDKWRFPKNNTGRFAYEEHTLSPNLLPVLLAFLSFPVIFSYRKKRNFLTNPAWYLLLILVSTFILSFGPFLVLGINESPIKIETPYYYLHEYSYILRGIRAPSRFQLLMYLPTSFFVALGAIFLLPKAGKRQKQVFTCLLAILIFENLAVQNYDSRSQVFNLLGQESLRKKLSFLKNSKTVHLPIPFIGNTNLIDFPKEARVLNWAVITGEITMNGYSGYLPPDYFKLLKKLSAGLDESGLKDLQQIGIDYIILHNNSYAGLKNYREATVFTRENITILSLNRLVPTSAICNLKQNLIVLAGSIKNNGNCPVATKGNDRYLITNGVKVVLPLIINPGESIIEGVPKITAR